MNRLLHPFSGIFPVFLIGLEADELHAGAVHRTRTRILRFLPQIVELLGPLVVFFVAGGLDIELVRLVEQILHLVPIVGLDPNPAKPDVQAVLARRGLIPVIM